MFKTEEVMKLLRESISEKKYNSSQLSYVTSYHDKLLNLCRNADDLILFGSGNFGKRILLDLIDNGLNNVRCFCDNKRAGDTVLDLPVLSLEEAKEKYPDGTYVITPKGCENEIIRQLAHADVSMDHVVIFIYSETGL